MNEAKRLMADKIAAILKAYTKKENIAASEAILESYAEVLVKRGVIIPPFNVGDDLYWINEEQNKVERQENAIAAVMYFGDGVWKIYDTDDIVNDVGTHFSYLTREEAEEALKGNTENGKEI